ncbi:MAG: 2OG-Fe dioxygenase family protein [Polyangiales bacterium]
MFRASLETTPGTAFESLRETGCALLAPAGLRALARVDEAALETLGASWRHLPADEHLRDGGRYRFRRHSCFTIDAGGPLVQVAHRAHYQPLDYNALHGGIERWFAPIEPEVVASEAFRELLASIGRALLASRPTPRWYVEAHQFRIDATGGIGRPTPEGAHRDGVDFVAVSLIGRTNVKGGETRVFESDGPHGIRFTMQEPWTTLLLDDERVIHETSPVQPVVAGEAFRDTLVLTFRSGGFQSPIS